MSNFPSLGIIIVAYNSREVIGPCLSALHESLTHIRGSVVEDTHVIIIDNASPNGAPDASKGGEYELVQLPRNVGFAPAVNWALDALPPKSLYLLLNPDAQLMPFALSSMIHNLMLRSAAVVGPVLVDERGDPRGLSERPFHSLPREAARQLFGIGVIKYAGSRAIKTGEARCLTGACLLIDGPFLRSVGGLDQTLPMYLEDVELCAAAHRQNRAVVLDKRATCYHALGGSSEGINFQTSYKLHLMLLLARYEFIRRRSRRQAVFFQVIVAVGAFLRCFLGWLLRRPAIYKKHWAAARWVVDPSLDGIWPP